MFKILKYIKNKVEYVLFEIHPETQLISLIVFILFLISAYIVYIS